MPLFCTFIHIYIYIYISQSPAPTGLGKGPEPGILAVVPWSRKYRKQWKTAVFYLFS